MSWSEPILSLCPGSPTILSIDDDPQITEAIDLQLRSYAVKVVGAPYGMHGFWLAVTEQPDLIITDLRMPQGQGNYVVKCLRDNANTQAIPVIVLTGVRGSAMQEQLRGLDVQAVFTKPVLFDNLLAAIGKYVPLRPRELEAVALRE